MDRSSISPAPPNAVAEEQFRKGFEFAKAGDLDEAILNVEAALAVSPEESRYHDLLGTLYAKKGLYEMAVAEWKR
jgi:tetratricopeptide (TPR) repeat protein